MAGMKGLILTCKHLQENRKIPRASKTWDILTPQSNDRALSQLL
jgi:hypothetical protein